MSSQLDHIDVEQGSDEWLAARAGLLTASVAKDALATTKSGWGASRSALKAKLVCEKLTGKPVETFVTDAMRRGTELEPSARATAELEYGVDIHQSGLWVRRYDWGDIGASLDGETDSGVIWEFKCPLPHTHLEYVRDPNKLAKRYNLQVQAQMLVRGFDRANIVSFCPDLPRGLDLVRAKIEAFDPDDLLVQLKDFVCEMQAEYDELKEKVRDE